MSTNAPARPAAPPLAALAAAYQLQVYADILSSYTGQRSPSPRTAELGRQLRQELADYDAQLRGLGRPAAPAPSAAARFDAAVAELVAGGLSRSTAIGQVAREQPALAEAYRVEGRRTKAED